MKRSKGFGLLELVVVRVVTGLFAPVVLPTYNRAVLRARVARAIGEIGSLDLEIEQFRLRNNDRIPLTLDELPIPIPTDPWDRPCEFLNIPAAGPGKEGPGKEAKLSPLNTDYDLYSRGQDGDSKGLFSAKAGKDNIVRANNGAFMCPGEDY